MFVIISLSSLDHSTIYLSMVAATYSFANWIISRFYFESLDHPLILSLSVESFLDLAFINHIISRFYNHTIIAGLSSCNLSLDSIWSTGRPKNPRKKILPAMRNEDFNSKKIDQFFLDSKWVPGLKSVIG